MLTWGCILLGLWDLVKKVFAWYPMDGHASDVTDNKRPLFYKVNSDGALSYVNNG